MVRVVASNGVRLDGFEQLLVLAGLETRDAWPVRGSALTPRMAERLLAVLMQKPVTLANFPSRLGASYLLREVMAGGEVSRAELLRRVERLRRVAVLRPDGYLAWVLTGSTQQRVAPVEWRDGAFRAMGFELGRFYVSNGYLFRPADEHLEPLFEGLQVEVYDDADYVSRTLDGAQEAFVELVLAVGQLLTTSPAENLEAFRHLPAGVAALVASSPEYLERFKRMTRGEQVQALSKLATTLIATWGTAGGTTRTLTATLGTEATVPVLSLSAEGALVLENVSVPVDSLATAVGTGVGGVYVLSTGNIGGGRGRGSEGGSRAGKDFTPGGKRQIDAANAAENGGVNRCKDCGVEVVPGEKSQRGVSPPANQRERDHIIPKSQGGDGAPSNGQILCRGCNLEKSDSR